MSPEKQAPDNAAPDTVLLDTDTLNKPLPDAPAEMTRDKPMGQPQTLDAWLTHISEQHWQVVDMGLERMQTMVRRLDLANPTSQVVTIAGTNGKGSTSVLLEQLLLQTGKRVGATLSPHVARFNERIRVNGLEVSDALIEQAFATVEEFRQGLPLTYFEFSALAALLCFNDARVDVIILEIGLGGRLDAFNVVDADVAVITSIGMDHEQFLGHDLDSIGAEKAGVLRAGQRVVLGPDMPGSVMAACRALGLKPRCFGQDFHVTGAHETSWQLHNDGAVLAFQAPAVAPQNVALAFSAAQALDVAPNAQDLTTAATRTHLPGRLQKRLLADRRLLLDVAHNPAGVEFLLRDLAERGIAPDCILLGMLQGKDHAGVGTRLLALQRASPRPRLLLADTSGERALSATALMQRAFPDAAAAVSADVAPLESGDISAALCSATQPGDVILVLGSFNVVEQCQIGTSGWPE